MTDRELLERAARAAGLEVFGDTHPNDGLNVVINKGVFVWRPLHDDGDEARLEAALGISITWHAHLVVSWVWDVGLVDEEFSAHSGDKQAARRRAGVRAAAMKGAD